MDECKGQPPAAAAERSEDSAMTDDEQPTAAPSSPNTDGANLPRLLPARAEAPGCDVCKEALEGGWAAAASSTDSRMPRLLPCGHSHCTSCIQKSLDDNEGLLKCPECGDFDPPQRIDSALKLPKNITLIKLIEALADRDAMAELAALPCQQCDPSQPRQPAKVHCDGCGSDFCSQHDQQAHTAPQLASHKRVSISEHAAKVGAAATAKRNAAFAAAAAINRMAAQVEEKRIKQALEDAQEQLTAPAQDLDVITSEVDDTAKELHAVADQLRSDFEKHRQMITHANQQLADSAATFAPLLHIAQQVQRADDFDANLQFAQLQRDSPQVHAQVQQVLHLSRRSFDVDSVRELRESLSLSHVKRQSLILNTGLAVQLAPLIHGLEFKAQPSLLYRASRDGFKKADFIRCCANKGPTMTVKDNGFVFGAYTHCAWPATPATVADPTGKSFLFSLVNATGKAVRFSLCAKERAIELSVHGLLFGAADVRDGQPSGLPNFILMLGPADQTGANGANDPNGRNTAYQLDGGQQCDAAFLAGQHFFAAAEIEVFHM